MLKVSSVATGGLSCLKIWARNGGILLVKATKMTLSMSGVQMKRYFRKISRVSSGRVLYGQIDLGIWSP